MTNTNEPSYAKGLYNQFDAAGWAYGQPPPPGEIEPPQWRDKRLHDNDTELDARIAQFTAAYIKANPDKPPPTGAEAETAIRLADRERAEALLRRYRRPHLIDQLGDQPPRYANAAFDPPTPAANDGTKPSRAFDEDDPWGPHTEAPPW